MKSIINAYKLNPNSYIFGYSPRHPDYKVIQNCVINTVLSIYKSTINMEYNLLFKFNKLHQEYNTLISNYSEETHPFQYEQFYINVNKDNQVI